MDVLYQGASAALMLTGIAVLLLGAAALLWSIGRLKAEQGLLATEEAARERMAARVQAQAHGTQKRMELVQALLPAVGTAVGHWLGSQSGRHAREDYPPAAATRCCGVPPPFPTDDDETHVELDFGSLVESMSESGFGDWLLTFMQQAKASSVPTTPEPGPDGASAVA